MKKYIIFSGGGSGGHVMPAVTLIQDLLKDSQYEIHYIGGKKGIEREIIKDYKVNYFPIQTGKLRRYFSWENLKDIFKVLMGIIQSVIILLKFPSKRTLVFSTGGFVSVPVVIGAALTRKKIFVHEQTSRIGLANKISSFFANKVFISFEESMKFLPSEKTELTGYPLRKECFENKINDVEIEGVNLGEIKKEILFLTGGGNGSLLLNNLIKNNIENLKRDYFIIHQVGKDFIEEYKGYQSKDYLPLAFINQNMIDIFKLAKIVISRAGAGTVSELIALNKKSILIPLKIAQKNEQFFNAKEAEKLVGSLVVEEDQLSEMNFIRELENFKNNLGEPLSVSNKENSKDLLIKKIQEAF
jgi:UDP-N-acetylglucosamine--N-acetylmuramyl-(pentapeptide) pyrophosphoryl-undecaprenol N-acetylglucosamine transferase